MLRYIKSIFKSTRCHKNILKTKRFYPCIVETPEESLMQSNVFLRNKLKNNELELCKTRSLLYKMHIGKKLDMEDSQYMQGQFFKHEQHRIKEMKAEIKYLQDAKYLLKKELGKEPEKDDKRREELRNLLDKIQNRLCKLNDNYRSRKFMIREDAGDITELREVLKQIQFHQIDG